MLTSRRRFLCVTGSLAAGLVLPVLSGDVLAAEKKEAGEKEHGVGPTEDLMREHGVLRRVLLAYDYIISSVPSARPF